MPDVQDAPAKSGVGVGQGQGVLAGNQSGIGYSFSNKFVLGVLSISLVMNGMVLPLQYFIPVIATDVLKVGPALGGVIGSAEGFGTLMGAIFIATRRNYAFHGRYYVIGAMIVAVCVAAVAWSPWFLISFLLLFSSVLVSQDSAPCRAPSCCSRHRLKCEGG